ncbi:MAG: SDR family NAD(P)-dependent oxidoreductase [Ornithinibacter sp.]
MTVLVTGASSGIGRATAHHLAERGHNLVLLARSPAGLEAVARECRAHGVRVLLTPADVSDRPALGGAFDAAVAEFGTVDAVVHCAAVLAYGRFEDVPPDVFDESVRVTLLGSANVARIALGHFSARGGHGRLVVVGSLLGKVATPFMSSYVTAKWGLHGLVRTLQIEARSTPGVDISLVTPGGVNTPVYRQAGTYLRRHGRPPPPVDSPEKVAGVIASVLARPRRDRGVGIANPLVVLGFRTLPGVFDRIVTPLMRIGGLGRESVPNGPGNVFEAEPGGESLHGVWSGTMSLTTDEEQAKP